ncbi:polymeric immunoglobulin receptor-like [Pholidichthys leucotaenia]
MGSLQHLVVTLCIYLSGVVSAAEVIHVSGYKGRAVNIPCPYPQGYESYEKYFCKNNCASDDILIKTSVDVDDDEDQTMSTYTILDDKTKQIFTVTMSNLNHRDAGKYWCGVTRTGKDIYTEVQLEVVDDVCCNNVIKIQTHEESSVSINCPYDSEYQNRLKYICRGIQPSICLQQALVTSHNQQNSGFTLTDGTMSGHFTVTITSVTQRDSGPYLCGIHRNTGLDVFSARVELTVKDWCCVKSERMRGIVGQPLTMQCHYPRKHGDNRKFLCKGNDRKSCTDMMMSQSRFMMQSDNTASRTFVVKISKLEAGDTGTYWCGSDSRWSVGDYTKIHLSVGKNNTAVSKNTIAL